MWSCVGQLNPLWTHSSCCLGNDILYWSLLRAGAIVILSSNVMENYMYLTGIVLVEGYSSWCTLYGFVQAPCTVFHTLNTSACSSALKKQRSVRMEANVICRMCTNSKTINTSGIRVFSLRYCMLGNRVRAAIKCLDLLRSGASKMISLWAFIPSECHYLGNDLDPIGQCRHF